MQEKTIEIYMTDQIGQQNFDSIPEDGRSKGSFWIILAVALSTSELQM
jgi:hypothetical protein